MSEDLFDLSSVDSDEMQHDAAFLLGLQCLQKYSFRGFPKYKGLIYIDILPSGKVTQIIPFCFTKLPPTEPRSAVGNVSGYRYVSDCIFRGR